MKDHQRASLGILIVVECWILALLLLAELAQSAFAVSAGDAIQLWSWLFVIVGVWTLFSWKYWVGPLLMPFPIFMLAAIAFNGGQLILQALHLNENGLIPDGGFDSQLIVKTAQYVTFGILAFHLGGMAAALCRRGPGSNSAYQDRDTALLFGMRAIGISLAIVGGAFVIQRKADEIRVVLQGSYLDLYKQEVGVGTAAAGSIVAAALVPGLIFALVGFRDRVKAQRMIILLLTITALTDLMLGYRAYAIWPVISALWVLHMLNFRLPRVTVVVGSAILMFVIFPIIRVARLAQSSDRWNLASLRQQYSHIDNPLTATLAEMGGSMITVAYTLELVPSTRKFDNGLGFLYALTAVIPNIFGDGAHPLARHGLPSVWLVTQAQPDVAKSGGGLGFSFLAEAYLNFGLIPSFIALIVLGFMISYGFSRLLASGSDLGIACAGISLSFLAQYARGELYIVIRSVAWYVILPSIAITLVAATARQRGLRSEQHVVQRRSRSY